MLPFYSDENCIIYNGDCHDIMPLLLTGGYEEFDLLFMDPPFEIWQEIDVSLLPQHKTMIRFTNPVRRYDVYEHFGKPRWELIWHFPDGRWVSHNGPRAHHEIILVYGETGEAYVGEPNEDMTPRKPYRGTWGGEVQYVPRERKLLTSVLTYPRFNPSNPGQCKPEALMRVLLEWIRPKTILDPFMGSGTTLKIAKEMNAQCIGIETEEEKCAHAVMRLAQEVLPL